VLKYIFFNNISVYSLHVLLSVTWQEKYIGFSKGAEGGTAITLSEGQSYNLPNDRFPDKFCTFSSFFFLYFFCVKAIEYSCPEIEYIYKRQR